MARTTKARSAVANTIKLHPDDHQAVAAARAELTGATIEDFVERKLASAPPL